MTPLRTYLRTHPWITFRVNLGEAPYSLWVLLGEVRSKCEHIAGVPLQPAIAQFLSSVYLIKGVHATTAIEGNTLSEDQIREHLEGRLRLPPSQEYQRREVDNLVNTFNRIAEQLMKAPARQRITPELICWFNAKVLEGLQLDEGVVPGKTRQYSVGVEGANYRGAPAEDCRFLLDRLCEWLNDEDFDRRGELGIAASVIKAVLAHLYLAWIHPFGDGNGRSARLLEFYMLVSAGAPVASAHLLSDHYNKTRAEYYRQLRYASETRGKVIPFIEYAVKGFVEGLADQIHLIQGQQLQICWRDFVNESFGDRPSPAQMRQRNLVLDLSWHAGPVRKKDLLELSARVAAAYAGKTEKTLTRDLGALQQQGLIERTPEGFRARDEMIFAFLPPRRREQFAGRQRR